MFYPLNDVPRERRNRCPTPGDEYVVKGEEEEFFCVTFVARPFFILAGLSKTLPLPNCDE